MRRLFIIILVSLTACLPESTKDKFSRVEKEIRSEYDINDTWDELVLGTTEEFLEAINKPGMEWFISPVIKDVIIDKDGSRILVLKHYSYEVRLRLNRSIPPVDKYESSIFVSELTDISTDGVINGDLIAVYTY